MSEIQVIESALQRAASRRRWAGALRGLWYGLLVGAIVAFLMVGVYHLWPVIFFGPLPTWVLLAAPLAPFPCMLIGLIAGGWRKPSMNEVARWLDGKQHLQERLST